MILLRHQTSEHILALASRTLVKRGALLSSNTDTTPILTEAEREAEKENQTTFF